MSDWFYKRKDIQNKAQYNMIAEKELQENAREVILKGIKVNPHDTPWDHNRYCGFKTGGRTEKRWCRCLVNYSDKEKVKNCENCVLKNDYGKPIENARFLDFEIPVSSKGDDGIGEVDVILQYEGEEYYTEVKPFWNGESILRMVAEIITYCYFLGDGKKKAILFAENSEQFFQWTGENNGKPYPYRASDLIRKIIRDNDIAVFCLYDQGSAYHIERLN